MASPLSESINDVLWKTQNPVEFSTLHEAIERLLTALADWERTYPCQRSVVVIAGPSASGKTTLSNALLLPNESTLLSLDRYYLSPSEQLERCGDCNFSIPSALDEARIVADVRRLTSAHEGEFVALPVYDMAQSARIGEESVKVGKRLIIEGVYALRQLSVDTPFTVFVESSPEILLKRKLARDVVERGTAEEIVRERFARNMLPALEQFILPQKQTARIRILNNS